MAEARKNPRLIGALIGVVLVAGGVTAVFLIERKTEVEAEPPAVRPLKTMVIASPFASSGRKHPGKVRPKQGVNLAFQVSGRMIELLVQKGQKVEQGELLARIDPRDFQNDLQAKQGVLAKAKADLARFERLFKDGHATDKELYDARSAFQVAEARANIATKALDDTHLRPPFTGVIANTFADRFENVQAKQSVLSLQDISSVEVEVSVPEKRVVRALEDKGKFRFAATFDYLPDREFEVSVKEFSTEADPVTQTYTATFAMPAPDDVLIMPGMTAGTSNHDPRRTHQETSSTVTGWTIRSLISSPRRTSTLTSR